MATRLELMGELRQLAKRSRWELVALLQGAAEKLDHDDLGSLVDDGWRRAEDVDMVTQMFEHYRRSVLRALRSKTTRHPREP